MRPTRESVDFTPYTGAFAVYAKNPTVIVLPLLAAVIGVLAQQIPMADSLMAQLESFVLRLLQFFALGGSIIIADAGWRRGVASFDEAWQDARRKGGDILFAAVAFVFILNIAAIFPVIGNVLAALAAYGLIFTIPAAAIGGIPGLAAANASVERVRSAPIAAAILAIVCVVLMIYGSEYLGGVLYAAIGDSPLIAQLAFSVVQAILTGYVAIVMAKVYSDVAFSRPRW